MEKMKKTNRELGSGSWRGCKFNEEGIGQDGERFVGFGLWVLVCGLPTMTDVVRRGW